VSTETTTAYLGVGGNLGDVRQTFSGALAVLRTSPGIAVRSVSPLYATKPMGGPVDQPSFLNAVIEIDTSLTAHDLLDRLLRIEADFSRERTIRWGPRTLDLDLLLFGRDVIINDPPDLIVPHPRLAERAFVLVPLTTLAASLNVPGTGQTVAALCAALPADARADVRPICHTWS